MSHNFASDDEIIDAVGNNLSSEILHIWEYFGISAFIE